MNQVLQAAGGGASLLILLVVMVVMMYFTGYRPAKKQREQQEKRKASLKVGDNVITVGGIKGKVVEITDKSFIIESANSGKIEFVMEALSHILERKEDEVVKTNEEKKEIEEEQKEVK